MKGFEIEDRDLGQEDILWRSWGVIRFKLRQWWWEERGGEGEDLGCVYVVMVGDGDGEGILDYVLNFFKR